MSKANISFFLILFFAGPFAWGLSTPQALWSDLEESLQKIQSQSSHWSSDRKDEIYEYPHVGANAKTQEKILLDVFEPQTQPLLQKAVQTGLLILLHSKLFRTQITQAGNYTATEVINALQVHPDFQQEAREILKAPVFEQVNTTIPRPPYSPKPRTQPEAPSFAFVRAKEALNWDSFTYDRKIYFTLDQQEWNASKFILMLTHELYTFYDYTTSLQFSINLKKFSHFQKPTSQLSNWILTAMRAFRMEAAVYQNFDYLTKLQTEVIYTTNPSETYCLELFKQLSAEILALPIYSSFSYLKSYEQQNIQIFLNTMTLQGSCRILTEPIVDIYTGAPNSGPRPRVGTVGGGGQ